MKKLLSFLALSLGASALQPLSADNNNYQQNYQQPGQYEYCCPDTCGWGKFSVGADWLYWKTEQTGLNYATETTLIDDEFRSTLLKPNFKYDNGYRVFADYTTVDTLWTFRAAYTHVPSKASNSFSSIGFTNFATILPFNFPSLDILSGTSLNSAGSSWHSKINYFDLDASRTYTVCQNLEITPHLGIRVLWMDQTFNVAATTIPDIGDLVNFDAQLKSKFTGVGLGGGLSGAWQFYDGLSLVGNVGGTVLYSHFKSHGSLTAGTDLAPAGFNSNYRESHHATIPTFDSFIGIQYVREVCGYAANIHVGWENHVIYQTNDFSFSSNGSTTLQGLTLGAAVVF